MRSARRLVGLAIALSSVAWTIAEADAAARWMRPPTWMHAPTWKKVSATNPPPARAACAMAYDPVSRKVVMFGGFGPAGYFNDTWTFDGNAWSKQQPANAPSPRAASNMAFDMKANTLVLFGGYNGSQYLGDTWIWDGATSEWVATHPKAAPTPVTGPAVFTDPLDGHADVFGGFDGMFYHAETWRWRGKTWKLLATPTEPYARSTMVYATDPATRSTVIFGGLGSQNPDNTWTWDGRQWAQQFPAVQPPLVYDSAAAYDPALLAVVTFGGGSGGTDLNDTYTWNGTTWAALSPATSPSARESFGMTYDDAVHRIVLFGGIYKNQVFYNDSWELIP